MPRLKMALFAALLLAACSPTPITPSATANVDDEVRRGGRGVWRPAAERIFAGAGRGGPNLCKLLVAVNLASNSYRLVSLVCQTPKAARLHQVKVDQFWSLHKYLGGGPALANIK